MDEFTRVDKQRYKMIFPNGWSGSDVTLFKSVVDAINSHPPEDIELLEPGNYNPNEVKIKFPDVIKIFVTHFESLTTKPDEASIINFPLLFKKQVKPRLHPTTTINGMSLDETVDCIGTFITKQIVHDRDTLGRITRRGNRTLAGTGWSGSDGSGAGSGAGGGRRSRRNSSSTRRRPRRGKSSATKRRRPHRRTSRK